MAVAPSADAHGQAASLVHALKGDDGKMVTSMRLSDGYIDITRMTQSQGKLLGNWNNTRAAKDYIKGVSEDIGIAIASLVVRETGRGAGKQGTWAHPDIAVEVAGWCSVKLKIQINRLVGRYLRGELTTAESKAAAGKAAEVVQVVDVAPSVPPQLIEWHGKRDEARTMTKAKSCALKEATGGKASWEYATFNDRMNWGTTGRHTETLRGEVGIKKGKTPRDYMTRGQLGLLSWQEHLAADVMREKVEEKGGFLSGAEALAVGREVSEMAHDMVIKAPACARRLMGTKPPTLKAVQKALKGKKTEKRQLTIAAAYLPVTKPLLAVKC